MLTELETPLLPELENIKEVMNKVSQKSYFWTERWANFCNQTTLHGWSYVAGEKHISQKILWIVTLTSAYSLAAYLAIKNLNDYMNSTTVTSINTIMAPLSDLSFPTIHICNTNQVTHSFLKELGFGDHFSDKSDIFFTEFIHGTSKKWSTKKEILLQEVKTQMQNVFSWNDTIHIRTISSQNCKDMLVRINRDGDGKTFYDAYKSTNDKGSCCAMIPRWVFEDDKKPEDFQGSDFQDERKDLRHGLTHGFKLMLDAETFDYADRRSGSSGFIIAIANSQDKPTISQIGLNVAPGTETRIPFTITKTITKNDAIDELIPEDRDCYQDAEATLSSLNNDQGFRFSLQNCLYEAKIRRIMENCSCIPMFVEPRLVDWYNGKRSSICTGEKLDCAEVFRNGYDLDLQKDLTSFYVGSKYKRCLPRCNRDEISAITSSLTFPNNHVFQRRKDICYVMKKLRKICTFSRYAMKKDLLEEAYGDVCDDLEKAYEKGKMCSKGNFHADDGDIKRYNKTVDFLFKYARDNFAVVNVYMRDPFYTIIDKKYAMPFYDLFSSLGGMLGLCLGLSIISVIEFMYHLVQGLIRVIWP